MECDLMALLAENRLQRASKKYTAVKKVKLMRKLKMLHVGNT